MSKYLIKVENNVKKLDDINISNGYEIDIKSKKYPLINKVTIYDNEMKNNYILKKLMKEYQNILKLMDEDDGSNTTIVLNSIEKLRATIEYEYKKNIKKEEYQKFINALFTLENMYNINEEEKIEVKR